MRLLYETLRRSCTLYVKLSPNIMLVRESRPCLHSHLAAITALHIFSTSRKMSSRPAFGFRPSAGSSQVPLLLKLKSTRSKRSSTCEKITAAASFEGTISNIVPSSFLVRRSFKQAVPGGSSDTNFSSIALSSSCTIVGKMGESRPVFRIGK